MTQEPRINIDIDIHGKSRTECCDKLAFDIMNRHALEIANHTIGLGISEKAQLEFLLGYHQGMSMAFEQILSGLNLLEMMRDLL